MITAFLRTDPDTSQQNLLQSIVNPERENDAVNLPIQHQPQVVNAVTVDTTQL